MSDPVSYTAASNAALTIIYSATATRSVLVDCGCGCGHDENCPSRRETVEAGVGEDG